MSCYSRYNYLFEDASRYFLYNSMSNSFAELDEETYQMLKRQKEGAEVRIDDEGLLERLKKMRAIVESDDDSFLRLKYLSMYRRMNTHKLALTINPTLDCNFACPYCFEGHHPKIYMTDEVEDGIIEFVKKHKDATAVDVTWFGGEPLLAFGRMETLSAKLIALGLEYAAGIITNGYLLDADVTSRLGDLKIKSIQVTLDGLADVHDRRRCLKGGGATFATIVDNVKRTHAARPEISMNVRVNVDKTNADDFIGIYKMFKTDEDLKGVTLSPAFVDDIRDTNKCVLNSKEQYDYVVRLLKEHGIGCAGKTARQITKADYEKYDYIIGMDEANLEDMRKRFGGDPDNKLHMLMDYTDRPGEVADPWFTRDFDAAWRDIYEGCKGMVAKLMR